MRFRTLAVAAAAAAMILSPAAPAIAATASPHYDYGCNAIWPWKGKDQVSLCIRVMAGPGHGNNAYVSWVQVGIAIGVKGPLYDYFPGFQKSGKFWIHTTLPASGKGLSIWDPPRNTNGQLSCLGGVWSTGVCWFPRISVNRDVGLDPYDRGQYPQSQYGENEICADLYFWPGYKHQGGPVCAEIYK